MGLKIKASPKQLRTDLLELVWPGDDAVDLEASDLIAWARSRGQSGLVIKKGEKPDLIKCRRLGDEGVNHYFSACFRGSPNAENVAFRFSLVSIKNCRDLRWGRPFGDIRGLDDDSMNTLGEISMELPWYILLDEVGKNQGVESDEEVSEDLLPISLPKALGALVLAETFRLRR